MSPVTQSSPPGTRPQESDARVTVGIDVGAYELSLVVRVGETNLRPETYKNDPRGHKAILKRITALKRPVRVCMEATSTYHLPLAVFLSRKGESAGIEVGVANPAKVKYYANSEEHRSKTDELDAAIIAEYAQTRRFRRWYLPTDSALALYLIGRRIVDLTKERTAETNRLHSLRPLRSLRLKATCAEKSIKDNIAAINKGILRLRQDAKKLIQEDPDNDDLYLKFRLLQTMKGIGELSAIRILCELSILSPDMTPRQWVAMAGLDPRRIQSGINKGKSRISKEGSAHMRSILYMCALSAIRWSPEVKRFYQLLQQRGKANKQAIVAVMRRFLHKIWGMFKNKAPYDPSKFYNFPPSSPVSVPASVPDPDPATVPSLAAVPSPTPIRVTDPVPAATPA